VLVSKPTANQIPTNRTDSTRSVSAFANKYTSMSVNNHAVKGASARSVYRDLFPSILGSVKSGDMVVFQLGHYDSPAPGSSQDTAEGCIGAAPGSGDGTITITSGCTGAQEVIRTFYVSAGTCRISHAKRRS